MNTEEATAQKKMLMKHPQILGLRQNKLIIFLPLPLKLVIDPGEDHVSTRDLVVTTTVTGCVHYSFASLFFKFKGEHL